VEELHRDTQASEVFPGQLGIFGRHPCIRPDILRLADRLVPVHRHHDLHGPLPRLAVIETGDLADIRPALLHPVEAGNPEIKVPSLDESRDLLGTENLHLCDTAVCNRRVVIPVGTLHLEVSLPEKKEGLLLQAPLGKCDIDHALFSATAKGKNVSMNIASAMFIRVMHPAPEQSTTRITAKNVSDSTH